MEFYCKATNGYNDDAGEKCTDVRVKFQYMKCRIDNASGHTGKGIYLLAEDERYFVDEHVTYYTARSSGNGTHGNGRPHGESHLQGLLYANNVE
jgi:hypothetical protein